MLTLVRVSEFPGVEKSDRVDAPAHLLAIVISHADAPIATWSSLLLDGEAVRRTLRRARGQTSIRGIAVLSTCSRTEVYAEAADPTLAGQDIRRLLQHETDTPPEVVDRMRTLRSTEAVLHLFRVAAGLESIALGEHEIMGQVRAALRLAAEAEVSGPLVHRLFERALATGARARQQTSIGRGATTLGHAAASALFESGLPGDEALAVVVGAGHMARQAARHLRGRGFSRMAIVNRSHAPALELAHELDASAHLLPELPALLGRARVVVTALHGSTPVIDRAMLAAIRTSQSPPLHLVDLGSPANIEPSCASLAGVRRIDLDGLQQRLSQSRLARAGHVTAAEKIVDEEVRAFDGWRTYRRLVPAARRLRETYLTEARLAVEREVRRGTVDDPRQLQRFADSLVRRLLHRPLTHLHAMARATAPDGERAMRLPELERCVLESHDVAPPVSDPATP